MPDRLLGPYRLERVLGTGSFATVWLAVDEVLDRQVAVKILADNWSQDSEVRRRFLSEARMLLTAESPRIVRGFQLGETPTGQPYLVMAWADRGTLGDRIDDRLREGRLFDVHEVVALSTDIAYALADVHTSGHLHRDVKPTNVLIRSTSTKRRTPGLAADETIVLADFGLARGLELTSITLVAGSPAYMAPEQARGLSQLDRRADLFALGRIMLELLTGEPGGSALTPAQAAKERVDLAAMLVSHSDGGGDPPPAVLVDLIARLTSEDPDERPDTADDVVAELLEIARGLGVETQPRAITASQPPRAVLGPPNRDSLTTTLEPPGDRSSGVAVSSGLAGAKSAVTPEPAGDGSPHSRRGMIAGAGALVVALIAVLAIVIGGGGGGDEAADSTTTAAKAVPRVDPTTAESVAADDTRPTGFVEMLLIPAELGAANREGANSQRGGCVHALDVCVASFAAANPDWDGWPDASAGEVPAEFTVTNGDSMATVSFAPDESTGLANVYTIVYS